MFQSRHHFGIKLLTAALVFSTGVATPLLRASGQQPGGPSVGSSAPFNPAPSANTTIPQQPVGTPPAASGAAPQTAPSANTPPGQAASPPTNARPLTPEAQTQQ